MSNANNTVIQGVIEEAIKEPRSPLNVFTLPCGYLDENGELHVEVELREMGGAEEEILGSRTIKSEQKMDLFLASCILRLGTITDRQKILAIVPDLLTGDRAFLFLSLRRVSLGDSFPIKQVCPNPLCKQETLMMFSLASMRIYRMPEPHKRLYDEVLPSGRKVSFRCQTGKDEQDREKRKKEVQDVHAQFVSRVVSLDGEKPSLPTIRALSFRDRDYLRGRFNEVDGGIETTLEITCPLCKHEYEREFDPTDPGFFSPSATLATWKRRSST